MTEMILTNATLILPDALVPGTVVIRSARRLTSARILSRSPPGSMTAAWRV